MWYRLFKKVEQEVSVEYVHGRFLLFRDLTSITVLLFAGCIVCWGAGLILERESFILGGILGVQFLLAGNFVEFTVNFPYAIAKSNFPQ